MLNSAAERGAERVLAHLGLENGHAARDIRELRDLLDAWRDARRTAWQTVIKVATTGILAALILGVAISDIPYVLHIKKPPHGRFQIQQCLISYWVLQHHTGFAIH
jgi:hypothetical protein